MNATPSLARWLRLLALFLFAMTMAAAARAACSPWAGKITINEYNIIGSNTETGVPFVELKFVDPGVLSAVKNNTWSFSGWTLTAYRANGQSFQKNLQDVYTGTPTNTANNICDSTTDLYFRVPFASNEVQDQASIVLKDNNGYVVDILRAAMKKNTTPTSFHPVPVSPYNCNLCEKASKNAACSPNSAPQLLNDTDYAAGNAQDQKNIQRFPDGTGIWKEAAGGGSKGEDTLCTTNDNILLVTKTASSYSVAQGGTVTYTITVKNGSATTAMTGVTVSDVIPVGLAFQSRTVSQGSTNTLAVGATNPSTLTWTVGNLAVGATATMTLTAQVTNGNIAIVNTAEATSTELAGTATQGSATLNALAVSVSANPASITLNGDTVFTITVTNRSSATVYDILASLPLPTGLTYVSHTAPDYGSFSRTTDTNQTWNVGPLGAGTTATMTLTAKGTQTGTRTFTATASSSTNYPGATYSGQASVTVTALAGNFTVVVPDFAAGDGVTGTITAPTISGAIASGFTNATRRVKFYYQTVLPATGASGSLRMDAWEAATNTSAVTHAVATSLGAAVVRDVYFDANGVGRFDLNYNNVGQLTLNAEWLPANEAAPPAGAPSSITGSDTFVVRPYRYDLATTVPPAGQAGGTSFDLTVTAQALCEAPAYWGYACTEGGYVTATNFAGAAATDVSLLVNGAGLNSAPALWCGTVTATCPNDETTAPVVSAGAFSGGVATISGLHWSEAGTAALQAQANYLASGSVTTSGGSARFIPGRFSGAGEVASPGGGFLYYGQPGLDIDQIITAQVIQPNGSYDRALNYANGVYGGTLATVRSLSQSGGADVTVCPDAACATPLTNGASACTWASGRCVVFDADALVQRAASPEAPKTVGFTVQLDDSEGVAGPCAVTSPVTCSGTGDALFNYGSIELRYGRVVVQNAFGSERLPLEVTLQAQYWDGSSWKLNVADSATEFLEGASGASALAYSPGAAAGNTSGSACYGVCAGNTAFNTGGDPADYGGSVILDNVKSTNPAAALSAAGVAPYYKAGAPDSTTFNGGALRLMLSATYPATGSMDITLAVPAWLQIGGAHPKGHVAFGIYNQQGKAKSIIYRREVR